MKNKILLRLILYFVSSFVIFAFVIGLLFAVLFSRHNIYVHHAELERRGENIARSLAEYMDADPAINNHHGRRRGMGGMMMGDRQGMMHTSSFLRFIEDVAMSDIWVIDSQSSEVVLSGQQVGLPHRDLPKNSEQIMAYALDGQVAFCDNFGTLWGNTDIIVAAPIILADGYIAGAVLLHSQAPAINQVTGSVLALLAYSMGFGILVSGLVAIILSRRFTLPINNMKVAALQISDGNFDVKTGVAQNDEIGELAIIMDGMANKLNKASREREKLDTLRKDFVANVSHELRTPITIIRGSLEALLDEVVEDADKVKNFYADMFEECKYLERLVADLLDLSRLQNNDFAIEAKLLDLKGIVADAAYTMSKISEQKNIYIALNCTDDKFLFMGDYDRLRQMLIIVLDNAIKFSPYNSTVTINLKKNNNEICISIHDQGQGIESNDIPYIFERFYKQRVEQNKMGTGLGLAIAKQIADRHGIRLSANNHVDGGAKFCFYAPLPNF